MRRSPLQNSRLHTGAYEHATQMLALKRALAATATVATAALFRARRPLARLLAGLVACGRRRSPIRYRLLRRSTTTTARAAFNELGKFWPPFCMEKNDDAQRRAHKRCIARHAARGRARFRAVIQNNNIEMRPNKRPQFIMAAGGDDHGGDHDGGCLPTRRLSVAQLAAHARHDETNVAAEKRRSFTRKMHTFI